MARVHSISGSGSRQIFVQRTSGDFCGLLYVLLVLLFSMRPTAHAQKLGVKAAVSSTEVFIGESFQFQIQILGSEHPPKLDLSGLNDFRVEDLGGQNNSSRSVTIINGRKSETVRRSYILNYRLTAKRTGNLTIPSLLIATDRGQVRTQPIRIVAKKPAETEDFKLRMTLSKTEGYVGEPLVLTLTWYLGKDVQGFEFSLPILSDDRFRFADAQVQQQRGQKYFRIPLGGEEVVGEQGRGAVDGKEYTTISLKKVLIPVKAGRVTLEPALVACEGLVGYKKQRDPFGGFFSDSLFGGKRGVYKKVVVPSNALELNIRPLPSAGRPANFAGHVGTYQIQASARPTEVNVGDPITLSIVMSGPDYLEHVGLPSLDLQENLTKDFKIPKERADGKVRGRAKTFTQTVRARTADIAEIPPIELPYFDTESGSYEVARSQPIPLTVKEARVVTAGDAEGLELPSVNRTKVKSWTRGIAHNYEGLDALTSQRFGPVVWLQSPSWLATLVVPPACYFALFFGLALIHRRHADPAAGRRRKAFPGFKQALNQSDSLNLEQILNAVSTYFSDKLNNPGGVLTFKDLCEPLTACGVGEEDLNELKNLYEACEAGRYGGGVDTDSVKDVAERALDLVSRLDGRIK